MSDIDLGTLVHTTALSVWKRYRMWVEREDVQSEGWAFVYANPARVQQAQEDPQSNRFLYMDLRRCMETYARAEKATRSGYSPEDEATYGSAALKMWVPYIIKGIVPTSAEKGTEGLPGGNTDPALGGNWMASYLDIKLAWESEALTEDDRWWLGGYYGEERTQKEIGAMAGGITPQAAGRHIDRAAERFLGLLNGALHVCSRQCQCEGESWVSEKWGLSRRPRGLRTDETL